MPVEPFQLRNALGIKDLAKSKLPVSTMLNCAHSLTNGTRRKRLDKTAHPQISIALVVKYNLR